MTFMDQHAQEMDDKTTVTIIQIFCNYKIHYHIINLFGNNGKDENQFFKHDLDSK